jgi:hypothetical protein
MKRALFAFSILALAGCATPRRPGVADYNKMEPTRGKAPNQTPILTVHCRTDVGLSIFPDLQRNFVTPLTDSEYCWVIDRIEIDAECPEAAQWTAKLHLDTGARIELSNLRGGEFFDDEGPSHFDAGLRRIFSKLDAEQQRDPELRRYIEEHGRRIAHRLRRP